MASFPQSFCPAKLSEVIRFFRKPTVGWIALTSVYLALLAMSWRRWPDPLVDFGRDLYIPWQMNQGAVLYRDIEHAYGPLSQYLNAALFRVFAPNFTTIAFADTLLAGLLAVLIYRIAFMAAGRGVAFLTTLMYVAVFAFGNYTKISNYNFICPFSHEATHGILLCFAVLHAWQMAFQRKSLMAIALAGFFAGLCFLTRAETFLAAFLLSLVAFAFWTITRPVLDRKPATGLAIFCLFFALPLAGWFVFSLLETGNASGALRSTAGAWWVLIHSGAITMPFYRNLMGTDTLGVNLMAMVTECTGALLAAVLVIYMALRLGDRPKHGAVLVVSLFLFMAFGPTQWMNTGRSIPLLTAAVLVGNVWRIWRDRRTAGDYEKSVPFALWATVSLALLIKIFAHVQLFHYGFYLALPAALLLVATAIHERERACVAMARCLRRPLPIATVPILTAVIVSFVIAFAGQCLWISLGNYSYRTLAVGVGANRFFALPSRLDDRGPVINTFLDGSEQHMEPGATLAVLPEGVLLNFLSGHPSSVRYVNFSPFEFAALGERAILLEFQAHSPDYIVLADRDMTEFGVEHFGVEGYGAEMLRWIEQTYDPVFRIGPRPFSGQGFGLEILKRKPAKTQGPRGASPLRDKVARPTRSTSDWEPGARDRPVP